MPCDSSHLVQTAREEAIQEAAKLLVWIRKKQRRKPEPLAAVLADDYYAEDPDDVIIPLLCYTIRSLGMDQREKILYNGRDPMSRKLADWWDEHKKADEAKRKRRRKSHAARK